MCYYTTGSALFDVLHLMLHCSSFLSSVKGNLLQCIEAMVRQ